MLWWGRLFGNKLAVGLCSALHNTAPALDELHLDGFAPQLILHGQPVQAA